MSQALTERGIPTRFESLAQGSAARGRNLELGRRTQIELKADQNFNPNNIIYLQDFLSRRAQNQFVTEGTRAFAESAKTPLRVAGLTMEAGAIALAIACSSPQPRDVLPTPSAVVDEVKPPASTNTPDVRPTATAASVGAFLPDLGDHRLNQIQKDISEGKTRSEAEIKDLNEVLTKRAEVKTWMNEKGEVKQLSQIDGLRTIQQVINTGEGYRLKSVYVAKAENPYGLAESQLAGIFHPEVFDVKDDIETADQNGGVVLRAEVINKLMREKAAPETQVVMAIPADITTAGEDKKVLVQESKDSVSKLERILLRIPPKSKAVTPYAESNGVAKVNVSPQVANHTTIYVARPLILGKFQLALTYYDNRLPVNSFETKTGDEIFEMGDAIIKVRPDLANNANPRLVPGLNLSMRGQQLFEEGGKLPQLGLTKANLLKQGESFVFVLSNTSPLIATSQ